MWAITGTAAGGGPAAGAAAPARCTSLPTGPEPAWTTTGRAGVLEQPPDRVEQRVVEVELPDLHVHLEHLDAVGERSATYAAASGSG